MSNNSQQQSFWKLIQSNKIEIPIIQRDYAQGRPDKKEVRENFLNDLLNALLKNEPLELDFVYGDIHNGIFQPLDGQQRLTTLFLLHWYVATKENKLEKHINELSKFTYQTRASSREFCTALIKKGEIDLHNLLPSDRNKGNELSKTIIDSPWFFLSWQKDPTIKAMLIMLDAIHEKISALIPYSDLWGKLTEQHIITFHHLTLEGFGLSDDLYIKMNARGKALTDFENFKAKFEQYIKQVIYKTDENGKEVSENGQKIILKDNWEKNLSLNDKDPTETFAHKIDTVWTDLFWKYKNDKNLIDDSIIKFIAGVAIIDYAKRRESTEDKIVFLFNEPSKVKPEYFLSKQAFDYLKTSFDVYSQKEKQYDKLIPKDLSLWNFINEEKSSLFIEFIKSSETSYRKRTLFFAQTEYLIKQGQNFNPDQFAEWMRVVRNIVQNSGIDSAETLRSAIALITELSVGCGDIYEYLAKYNVKSDFGSDQTKEELLKAKLIRESESWRALIFKAEDHPLFQGCIGFLLNQGEKEEINLETFKHRLYNAEQVFDGNGINEHFEKDALFLRTFVSRFKDWGHLWGFIYDGTRDNWKKIFGVQYLRPYLLQLLDTDQSEWKTFLSEPSGLSDGEGHKAVHEDLYKSELLASSIVNGCRLKHTWGDLYFLHPYNAKDRSKKYVVGNKRNRLLSNLEDKGVCKLEYPHQRLTIDGNRIPFFSGIEIPIGYKNGIVIWKFTDTNKSKYTNTFTIDGEVLNLNDDELNDLPKKWDELLQKTMDSPLT